MNVTSLENRVKNLQNWFSPFLLSPNTSALQVETRNLIPKSKSFDVNCVPYFYSTCLPCSFQTPERTFFFFNSPVQAFDVFEMQSHFRRQQFFFFCDFEHFLARQQDPLDRNFWQTAYGNGENQKERQMIFFSGCRTRRNKKKSCFSVSFNHLFYFILPYQKISVRFQRNNKTLTFPKLEEFLLLDFEIGVPNNAIHYLKINRKAKRFLSCHLESLVGPLSSRFNVLASHRQERAWWPKRRRSDVMLCSQQFAQNKRKKPSLQKKKFHPIVFIEIEDEEKKENKTAFASTSLLGSSCNKRFQTEKEKKEDLVGCQQQSRVTSKANFITKPTESLQKSKSKRKSKAILKTKARSKTTSKPKKTVLNPKTQKQHELRLLSSSDLLCFPKNKNKKRVTAKPASLQFFENDSESTDSEISSSQDEIECIGEKKQEKPQGESKESNLWKKNKKRNQKVNVDSDSGFIFASQKRQKCSSENKSSTFVSSPNKNLILSVDQEASFLSASTILQTFVDLLFLGFYLKLALPTQISPFRKWSELYMDCLLHQNESSEKISTETLKIKKQFLIYNTSVQTFWNKETATKRILEQEKRAWKRKMDELKSSEEKNIFLFLIQHENKNTNAKNENKKENEKYKRMQAIRVNEVVVSIIAEQRKEECCIRFIIENFFQLYAFVQKRIQILWNLFLQEEVFD